ncbi:MAG: hypothetical protein ABR497_10810 [Kiritimatiellia bacterium]
MQIWVAGKPAPELAGQVRAAADDMARGPRRPDEVSPEIGAPALAHCASDADYLEHFMRLLRYRDAVDTLDFEIPCRPGPAGRLMRALKRVLWKLLRYQHDRIAFRQNLINGLHTQALEWELRQRQREIAELRGRITALERQAEGGHAD